MFQQEVMDKVTRQCPQTTTFWRERGAEVESNRRLSASLPAYNALPLGQTGSRHYVYLLTSLPHGFLSSDVRLFAKLRLLLSTTICAWKRDYRLIDMSYTMYMRLLLSLGLGR